VWTFARKGVTSVPIFKSSRSGDSGITCRHSGPVGRHDVVIHMMSLLSTVLINTIHDTSTHQRLANRTFQVAQYLSWWHVNSEVNIAEWPAANLAHQAILSIDEEVGLGTGSNWRNCFVGPMWSHCSQHCTSTRADRHQNYSGSSTVQILSHMHDIVHLLPRPHGVNVSPCQQRPQCILDK